MIKEIGLYFLCALSVLLIWSCGKGGCNVVPNVSFSTTIGQGSNLDVLTPGGWSYAKGGVCGLIVYNNGTDVLAYDRCSTVNIGERNQVMVEGFEIIDKASGAKWLLLDGSPSHIAECHLKPYNVSKKGYLYTISN